jgi:2-oxoacid:acceptor oxidoreductase gamma subunit (pyruvate/2-ketoisovalerate family)
MIGIRFHGRGGQGAVLASKILARAYFTQGFYVQSFPSFGMERKGAAVAAFVRVSTKPIVERGEIQNPSIVVVLDPTLLQMVDITKGLEPGGTILLNYLSRDNSRPIAGSFKLAAVDAGSIALEYGLGTEAAPIVNTVILGAFAKIVDDLSLEHVLSAIETSVPVNPAQNTAAANASYSSVFWLPGQSTDLTENPVTPQQTIQTLEALPTVPETQGSMSWNQTGSWRYLTPVATNKLPPCRSKCPAGMPIPEILAELGSNRIPEALRLILSVNPLPGLTGRLCYHPCQTDCLRRKVDQPVQIRQLEHFIAAQAFDVALEPPDDKSKRVAVLGAGPVGLACGYFLGRSGYRVRVLAKESQPGGALLDLSPEKLDPQVLRTDIERLVRLSNIELQLDASVDSHLLSELESSFDRVIVDPGEFTDQSPAGDAIKDFINAQSGKNKKIVLPEIPQTLFPFKYSRITHYIAAGRAVAEKAISDLTEQNGPIPDTRSAGDPHDPALPIVPSKLAEIKIERFCAEKSQPHKNVPKGSVIGRDEALSEANRCLSCGTCNLCLQCVSSCPDESIHRSRNSTGVTFDLYHCKGCGLCAYECPRDVISMEKIVQ